MRAYRNEQFDAWCREVIEQIENTSNPIALETSGRLMQMESTRGTLKVNYSDRLARFFYGL